MNKISRHVLEINNNKKKNLELKAKSHTHQNNAILGRHVDINYILAETQLLFGTAYAFEVMPQACSFLRQVNSHAALSLAGNKLPHSIGFLLNVATAVAAVSF